jgi:hypothetical protein
MFPPTRFSLSRWLFRIKPAVFSAFVHLYLLKSRPVRVPIDNIVPYKNQLIFLLL